MHWAPLLLAFIGVFAIIKAVTMDSTSNFDNGSFLSQMLIGVIGILCIIVAIITLLVQWAMS